jgi:hypothetical protein
MALWKIKAGLDLRHVPAEEETAQARAARRRGGERRGDEGDLPPPETLRVFRKGDIIEDDRDLAAMDPGKYEAAPQGTEASGGTETALIGSSTVNRPGQVGLAPAPGPSGAAGQAEARRMEVDSQNLNPDTRASTQPRAGTSTSTAATPPEEDDGLDNKEVLVADLEKIAEDEEIDLTNAPHKADKIRAIRAHRARQASK